MQVSKWLAAGSFALLAFGPQWACATGYPNAPVTTVVSVPFILTINAENPRVAGVVDVKSLVDLARRNPNTVSYGSAGNGNLMHLAGSPAGDHVRYADAACPVPGRGADGGGLMSKEVDFGLDTLSGVPLIKAGKLKALAVSTAQRWHDLPEVPAVAELGYPGFDISFWVGIFFPPARLRCAWLTRRTHSSMASWCAAARGPNCWRIRSCRKPIWEFDMGDPRRDVLPEYEVYAIRYARMPRRRRDNFLGGDPHDATCRWTSSSGWCVAPDASCWSTPDSMPRRRISAAAS